MCVCVRVCVYVSLVRQYESFCLRVVFGIQISKLASCKTSFFFDALT